MATKAIESVPVVGEILRKECALDATKTFVMAAAWGATKLSAGPIATVIASAQSASASTFVILKVISKAGKAVRMHPAMVVGR